MFEADSQKFAPAPRGFKFQNFRARLQRLPPPFQATNAAEDLRDWLQPRLSEWPTVTPSLMQVFGAVWASLTAQHVGAEHQTGGHPTPPKASRQDPRLGGWGVTDGGRRDL
uniref:Uncharacterized protein n=1 Tax=Eutreptiella gymnastica TaxID=73025 RepID=A0A7S4LBS3_9EUGL